MAMIEKVRDGILLNQQRPGMQPHQDHDADQNEP